ncbi:MFS transporter [Halalkalicoccus tibetensis]|uniref:Nitrate/nitrite transporter n=1 Tax=Halalkalicoccus tibetensis TaxID=175632 RepID=A0ABD5V1D0_9EURY
MGDNGDPREEYGITGNPRRGLAMATLSFFAGLTTIAFYGVAGPTFQEALGISGALLGLLLSSPHISKVILRVPFGAWVDDIGARTPILILLAMTIVGIAGLVGTLVLFYPDDFGSHLYVPLLVFGILAGAGSATFSVGIAQTSYWFPEDRQGFAMGAFAGAGNIGPGVFNSLIPVLIGIGGLAIAYSAWLVFMIVVTVLYFAYGANPYYFQLLDRGLDAEKAKGVAEEMGQEVFPAGDTWDSLRESSMNHWTWVLVFLYTVSYGGGFTALTTWYPTYWNLFHDMSLTMAGLFAGVFVVYGSLIRIPGGSLSDRFGGEDVAAVSFAVMVAGAGIATFATGITASFVGMMVLGTGMGIANAAVFELVPKYVPDAVGGASGWIGGIGGAGTLLVLPLLGVFVDVFGEIGYARGFSVIAGLSAACVAVSVALKFVGPDASGAADESAMH